MKTFLRTFAWLPLIVWLGGEFFFVITAWAAFHTLPYDTHAAGTIVRLCLLTLHREGIYCGCIMIIFLALGFGVRAFRSTALPAVLVVLIMMGLTAYSQYSIIPRMDRDLAATGGTIESVPPTNPSRVEFNRLHHVSVDVESAVMISGVLVAVLLAHASGIEDRR